MTVRRQKFPVIALEGVPFVFATCAVGYFLFLYVGPLTLIATLAVLLVLILVFRDPKRQIPAEPLGVLSPVDGVLESISKPGDGEDMHVLRLRIDRLGSYTARAPVEGKIESLRSRDGDERFGSHALWLQTDEGDDVILRFQSLLLGIPPRGLKGYGERFGQGQRCAYLRLAGRAELFLPAESQILISANDALVAGETLLAKLPSS
jgi:phosphatidylserine decarboxylase